MPNCWRWTSFCYLAYLLYELAKHKVCQVKINKSLDLVEYKKIRNLREFVWIEKRIRRLS
jgi:hypothetical protein